MGSLKFLIIMNTGSRDTLEVLDELTGEMRAGIVAARVDYYETGAFPVGDHEGQTETFRNGYTSEGARILYNPSHAIRVSDLMSAEGRTRLSRLRI